MVIYHVSKYFVQTQWNQRIEANSAGRYHQMCIMCIWLSILSGYYTFAKFVFLPFIFIAANIRVCIRLVVEEPGLDILSLLA